MFYEIEKYIFQYIFKNQLFHFIMKFVFFKIILIRYSVNIPQPVDFWIITWLTYDLQILELGVDWWWMLLGSVQNYTKPMLTKLAPN